LVAAAKFLAAAAKNLFVVPNFVAATKPFFSVYTVPLYGVKPGGSTYFAYFSKTYDQPNK